MDEGNLDLEAIIRELESELSEGEDDEEEVEESTEAVEEGEEIEEEYEIDEAALTEDDDDDDDDDDDKVEEELDKSSDIGKSDNNRGSTDASSGVGTGGQEDAKKLGDALAELKEYKDAVHFLKGKTK